MGASDRPSGSPWIGVPSFLPVMTRRDRRPHCRRGALSVALGALLVLPGYAWSNDRPSRVPVVETRSRPAGPYPCAPHGDQGIAGTYGDASAIGWEGNRQGVVACLGGSFYVQDGINTTYGFGIYDDSRTSWTNADGYLPALITAFRHGGADVAITNFADQVDIGGNQYVAVYSRVAVHNPTGQAMRVDPQPSPSLLPLDQAPITVPARATARHDYVVAVDRFGQTYPWPTPDALQRAGGYDAHFAHMRSFWDQQLAAIAHIQVPDPRLDDAYRIGFIDTQIARSGNHLNTGVNGYESEFSHDVIGILANLFTQGDFADAHALLLDARDAVGSQGQYEDGVWTYPWPWAIYLLKTGDVGFVRANFATEGPAGPGSPSIEEAAHRIAADRTGPGGIMRRTDDIDSNGYWTLDNYEALMGLAAYRYVAQRVGDSGEAAWATSEYASLLAVTSSTLASTIARFHLRGLPCSMLQSNDHNRCLNPQDANWAAPFLSGRWAWDGALFGASITGPGVDLIDATYTDGFKQLKGTLPANTFGGYPDFYYYSTGYNAGYGSWGLASTRHRDQGILSYEFMIDKTQSGPLSWWESVSAPNPKSPWVGSHPRTGQGSSPHAWGMANANKVLLDSLIAQRSDGTLIIGRGVPASWTRSGQRLAVSNFPTTDGRRYGFTLSTHGRSVSLALTGDATDGNVLVELPAFVGNLSRTSVGTLDHAAGTVRLPSGIRHVAIELAH